jgi:hypothetical protein
MRPGDGCALGASLKGTVDSVPLAFLSSAEHNGENTYPEFKESANI